jgi:hypothetical protein
MASRSRLAGAGFKPPGAAALKRRGGERPRKSHPLRWQVRVEKMNESEPSDDASLRTKALSKLRPRSSFRISRGDTCLRPRRQSVFRRHDLNAGSDMERENLVSDAKENDKWLTP